MRGRGERYPPSARIVTSDKFDKFYSLKLKFTKFITRRIR